MAQPTPTRVGIAGVTGKFAGLILDSLLEDPRVSIRGYCRNASKLASRYTQSSQIEIIEGSADDKAALAKFVEGLDVVICAYLGDHDLMINGQKALVDACDQAKVDRYVASDYSFDYTQLKMGDHPAKDPMKIIYSYLKEKDHVKGVHVVVGAFMETFWSTYFQVWNADEKTLVYWGSGEEKFESTTYGDSAKYTAAVALDRNAVGLQKFLGDRKNIVEIGQAIEKAYGFQPKLKCLGSLDELYTHMQGLFKKDPSNVFAWLSFFYQYYCINGQTHISNDLDNARYPDVKPQTFQDFLNTHALEELPTAMVDLAKRD